jgi:hypothetical protein
MLVGIRKHPALSFLCAAFISNIANAGRYRLNIITVMEKLSG